MKTNFEPVRYLDDGVLSSVGSGAAAGASLGSVVPGFGTLVGGLVGAGVGLFSGLSQKKKANALLKGNQYPTATVPEAELQNQAMAKNQALGGLPSVTYQNMMKDIERQKNQAIAGQQDRRSAEQTIAATQQNADDANQNVNSQDAIQRIQNQRTLYGVNSQVGAYQDKAADWNQRNKYNQNYAYGMSLLGQGNQNVISGIDSGVAGIMRSGALNGINISGRKRTPYDPSGGDPNYYGSDPLGPGPAAQDPYNLPGNS